MNPMDMIRSRIDSWRAHPFQQGISSLAGVFGGPLGGFGAQAGFNRLNDSNFNRAAQSGYDRSLQSTTMDANSAMNAPLNGPLGNYDRSGDNGQPGNYGGMPGAPSGGSYGGSPNTQNWQYGQFNTTNPQPPAQSSFVNSILNSIGPNGPGMSGNSGGMGPMGGMAGGGQGAFGSALAGGGFGNLMNGASSNMLADFAAPTGGDWMQRIGTHTGQNGPSRGAATR